MESQSYRTFITRINFISSKDNDKDRVMHLKSDNIEIMISMNLLKNCLNHFLIDINLYWKHQ